MPSEVSHPFSMLVFLGALAIFLYGMRLGRIGLQLAGGDRLRALIASVTNNRVMAMGIGAVTTLILQSSSATTVMLVGLASSQLINITQAMAVILGADVGTSLTVLLLSVKKMSEYALIILILGVLLDLVSKKKRTRYYSMIFLGFGFVFYGMNLMTQSMVPLRENEWVILVIKALVEHPFANMLFATIFTALVHSSAATLGMAIALAFGGTISLEAAIPIIFGANIGTCGTALTACLAGNTEGKRVAFGHFLFKVGGVLIFFPFIRHFAQLIEWLTSFSFISISTVAPQIALSHLIFNLALALIFIPFVQQGVWIVRQILPYSSEEQEKCFAPKYLDKSALETPALALAHAKREILRMADIAYEMFKEVLVVFSHRDLEKIEFLESKDDQLDLLNREIKFYLARLSQSSLTDVEADTEMSYVNMVSDIEEIGDIINRNLMELAEKKIRKVREFSEQGWEEIRTFHVKVTENFDLAISALTTGDEAIAKTVVRRDQQIRDLEKEMRQTHLNRLHQGLKVSFESSSLHMDTLANLQRINSKITAIVLHGFHQLEAPSQVRGESV